MKILFIYGTRPEAIKLAPVIRAVRDTPDMDAICCVTAQHREMLDQVSELFEITPDYDLDIMKPNQSINEIMANVFSYLPSIIDEVKPDWILVQGDTSTAMASTLAGYHAKIKIGHVEAGLRTADKWDPFPEEINRQVISVVADLHFAPTEQARRNLLDEGISHNAIFVTGNPGIDSLYLIAAKPYDLPSGPVSDLDFANEMILVTTHRRENFGEPIRNICQAIRELAGHYNKLEFIYPVHLNPNVQNSVHSFLSDIKNVHLLPPLDYHSLTYLLKRTKLVLTDSGGLQEEASAFNVPVLILRNKTERPEGVSAGVSRIVGTEIENIVGAVANLFEQPDEYKQMLVAANPYGDGEAAGRIVKALQNFRI